MSKMPRTAQASLEYLINYAWAVLLLVIFIGVLFYFDLFNTQKYAAQQCLFDSNFVCSDYNVIGKGATFDLRLLLQNNMDNNIVLNQTLIYDNDLNSEILCASLFVYCPNDDSFANHRALPSNAKVEYIDPTRPWIPTRLCRFDYTDCAKTVTKDQKINLRLALNFSGEGKTATHLSYGGLYANVQ